MNEHEKDGFLVAMGQRIRSLRTAAGRNISIQQLAQRSAISPRFLSEIEAGRGNISIARLAQLAGALGQPLASLIPEATDDTSLRGRVLKLVDNCQPDKLEELYAWLSESNSEPDPRSIALVGVRGAGKSTIGKLLASRLGIPFIEFDAMIENAAGISLVELFALHGESYYRKLEKEVLSKFLAHSPRTVLATGGSLVTDMETWGAVKRQCRTIWLKARAKDHWNRVVAQGDMRPMVNNPSAMDDLRGLLRSRTPLYAEAELVIDTSKHTVGKSVEIIVKQLDQAIRPVRDPAAKGRRRVKGQG